LRTKGKGKPEEGKMNHEKIRERRVRVARVLQIVIENDQK
jgi:hypothetical protein